MVDSCHQSSQFSGIKLPHNNFTNNKIFHMIYKYITHDSEIGYLSCHNLKVHLSVKPINKVQHFRNFYCHTKK